MQPEAGPPRARETGQRTRHGCCGSTTGLEVQLSRAGGAGAGGCSAGAEGRAWGEGCPTGAGVQRRERVMGCGKGALYGQGGDGGRRESGRWGVLRGSRKPELMAEV